MNTNTTRTNTEPTSTHKILRTMAQNKRSIKSQTPQQEHTWRFLMVSPDDLIVTGWDQSSGCSRMLQPAKYGGSDPLLVDHLCGNILILRSSLR